VELANPQRLAALQRSGLLDGLPEEEFDRITRLASRLLGAPVALLSLVDDKRQMFKSQVGLPSQFADAGETPLSHSFCQHVVLTEEPFIVEDARTDPRLEANLAIVDLGVVSYCGFPLRTNDGFVLGSFCVIDHRPRVWTNDELESVEDLAQMVMTEVELRAALVHERDLRQEKDEVARMLQAALLPPILLDIDGIDLATAYLPQGTGELVGGDFYDIFQSHGDRSHIVIGDVCGKGITAARTSLLVRHVLRAAALRGDNSVASFRLVDEALVQQMHPFVAAAHVVIDRAEQSLRCDVTIAGQPLPLLLKDGKVDVLGEYGTVLGAGVESPLHFGTATCVLNPGDMLMLFTDGVTDNPVGGLNEIDLRDRLNDVLPQTTNEAIESLVALAYGKGNQHRGVQHRSPIDDIAIVAIGAPTVPAT
jgi:sigma-B regulation protein RsbU (phosphoserine phosphatase)